MQQSKMQSEANKIAKLFKEGSNSHRYATLSAYALAGGYAGFGMNETGKKKADTVTADACGILDLNWPTTAKNYSGKVDQGERTERSFASNAVKIAEYIPDVIAAWQSWNSPYDHKGNALKLIVTTCKTAVLANDTGTIVDKLDDNKNVVGQTISADVLNAACKKESDKVNKTPQTQAERLAKLRTTIETGLTATIERFGYQGVEIAKVTAAFDKAIKTASHTLDDPKKDPGKGKAAVPATAEEKAAFVATISADDLKAALAKIEDAS